MSWIQTYTGKRVDLLTPTAEQIDLRDIAHALAMTCRFAGHTSPFYSVAQHSVLISQICEERDAIYGLLHDAAEAYVGDVTRPLKKVIPGYRDIEERIQFAIWTRFGLTPTPSIHERIKLWDNIALATEARDLFDCKPIDGWCRRLPSPLAEPLRAWQNHRYINMRFLRRFLQIAVDSANPLLLEAAHQAIDQPEEAQAGPPLNAATAPDITLRPFDPAKDFYGDGGATALTGPATVYGQLTTDKDRMEAAWAAAEGEQPRPEGLGEECQVR